MSRFQSGSQKAAVAEMPFGLRISPSVFTWTIKKEKKVNILAYPDNSLVLPSSVQKCMRYRDRTLLVFRDETDNFKEILPASSPSVHMVKHKMGHIARMHVPTSKQSGKPP